MRERVARGNVIFKSWNNCLINLTAPEGGDAR